MEKKITKKMSRFTALFFGINYIIGIGFVMTIGQLYSFLGLWFILALFLVSTIAYSVGISYAVIVRNYPNSYSGGYIVTRRAFGKKVGLLNVWSSYIQSPILAVVSIAGIVWTFQGTEIYNNFKWLIILGAALLFFLIIWIMNHGFNSSKWLVFILSSLKWLVILGVLIFATIYFFYSLHNIEGVCNRLVNPPHLKGLSFLNICSATSLIFFCFGGIEGISVINAEVENPKKIVPWAIMTTVIIGFIIYVLFFIFMLNALGPSGKNSLNPTDAIDPNPINSLIATFGVGTFATIGTIFLWIAIPSQIANKATLRIQAAWVQTRNLLVLTIDGVFPRYFAKVNKHSQFSRCVWLDSIICFVFIAFFVIISLLNNSYAERLESSLNAASLTFIMMYMTSTLAILKEYKNKSIELSKIELIIVVYATIGIAFLAFSLVYPVVVITINSTKIEDIVVAWLPYIFFIPLLMIGFILNFISNKYFSNEKFPTSFVDYVRENPDLKLYQYFPEGDLHPLAKQIKNDIAKPQCE
ncbi:hypothetical protein ASO20_00945 [Mycoplasma sp. (ex Biomphalaria glabrata)]|uniref:APC family permease n=1 Tax=Mycoplasma sp. (ex Biomphalaria glabrata) TaxID=1749074 RepID=UPI00073A662C|nr:APC family permease [Mycoplasma sp. (ex Biomphalaria glabrata)]ALV23236.1 hypothetical protein ASO20_00945 [Mycoplasma sp. (ex Biomphalaria glabrata)]